MRTLTHTDRIRQMAQEAGFSVEEDGAINDGVETAADFSEELARFARLVAQDFSEAYTEAVRMSPHISSVEFIRDRYSLND